MLSLAKRRLPPSRRMGILFAALLGCGLLAACSEAPKLAKAPQPTQEANEPAKPSPQATYPDADRQADGAVRSASKTYKRARSQESPSAASEGSSEFDTNEAAKNDQQAGGGAAPETPRDEPRAGMAEPEMPSGGAAPPSDARAPESLPPPGSMGEGAPSPVEEAPPPFVEAAPPPPPPAAEPPMPSAAPGAAARAGAEAAAAATVARRAEEAARAAAATREAEEAKAGASATPVPDPAKTYDVVPVFYGTDRQVEPDPNRLQFGSERGHKLQLGRALITVPLIHKVPHIERPVVIEIPYFKVKIYEEKEDPQKHFTVQEITSLSEEQMLALIKERLATSTTYKDHAFVFIHGFNTSFDCALYRTAQIAYDLRFDGVPFLYSWPSGGKVASYTYDHGSVEQAEPTLAEFLKLVIQKSGAKSISLIAHSMGNELLLRVLERMKPEVPKGVVISQVILAAPDVDRDKFNIIAREITNFAKGVTLYAASNDRALGYSARFWGGVPRAGDVPKVGGPLIIPGVDTIDVTAVSTDALGLNHSGYAENPALLNDVKALVEFGIRPPDKRIKNVLTVQSEAGTFWRFQAAE
jgi:esterase/lipase superfamily enzyme